MNEEIHPFRIQTPQADLDDLADRLARTRWTGELAGVGDAYGVPLRQVQELVAYWRDGYDWRAWEARLNSHPQFTTTIDGQRIHFLHVRSPHPDATPLVLTHGWPMSVAEYLDVIAPLTEPQDPADAFHLVIPHLPGFGWSGPTTERGWDYRRTARAWAELMRRLGYGRYGAHGNDAGSIVTPELGRVDPEHVVGVHVTQILSFPSGDPAETAGFDEADREKLRFLEWFMEHKGAFNKLQSTEPQTLAHALADSPVGQLAWSLQLFGDTVSPDYTLTNVMVHWLTGTAASAARFYYENARAEPAAEPTTVPLGLANFAQDFQSIRPLAERDHKNIVSWNSYDRGSHFAAHDAPDLLVGDIRGFFRGLAG
ncbi:epoxide hydrolase family protein [Peterkaempfera sp. SMS 1(5)a]|uniref:epoxide hydrolase family protein n=1 Tax=Peterkaempfera podocarpi TaxID=3232308 RepID=UPI00367093BE